MARAPVSKPGVAGSSPATPASNFKSLAGLSRERAENSWAWGPLLVPNWVPPERAKEHLRTSSLVLLLP